MGGLVALFTIQGEEKKGGEKSAAGKRQENAVKKIKILTRSPK